MAWTGAATAEHWSSAPREVDFFDLKGLVEHLCGALEVPVRFTADRLSTLVPGQSAIVVADAGPARNTTLGIVGQLLPSIADGRGLPRQDRVMVAELDLDALAAARVAASDATRALPRYPFVVRDLSIVVANVLPAAVIRGTILAAARDASRSDAPTAPLVATSFFDRYQGKGVPDGSVSLSVRLTFQAEDRTLTDAEVQISVDTILAALVREHGAVQR
jgi:phenylalanyl-tRNA synthetase beta chain